MAELEKVVADSKQFSAQVKELVNIVYEVYAETIFSTKELRAVTLMAHERAYVEEMKEMILFAAAFPEKKPDYIAKLVQAEKVFVQTIDMLMRNGAMFGVAPPPSPEAQTALELVEEHWKPKGELIAAIAASGEVATTEIDDFMEKSQSVSEELDAAMRAINDALLRA